MAVTRTSGGAGAPGPFKPKARLDTSQVQDLRGKKSVVCGPKGMVRVTQRKPPPSKVARKLPR